MVDTAVSPATTPSSPGEYAGVVLMGSPRGSPMIVAPARAARKWQTANGPLVAPANPNYHLNSPPQQPRAAAALRTVVLLASLAAATAHGGLYYSGETPAELPSQWRGFLLDHRAPRLVGVAPAPGAPLHVLREQYEDAAARLEAAATKRSLTADEAADLGALHVRLGRPVKAVEVLRRALRDHSDHFYLAANLGTAWQAQGDLDEAARALQQAVRLAPARWKPFEEAHLKLVRLRQKEPKGAATLDDLFGVTFVGSSGKPEPGKIDPDSRKKLPADNVAMVQQLALWLPADARLLWQLGELANAHGDVRTAAAILEGVVSEFAFTTAEVRERRKVYRAAADEIVRLPDAEHAKYRGDVVFRSNPPITRQFDAASQPEIRPAGVNLLPCPVLADGAASNPSSPRART